MTDKIEPGSERLVYRKTLKDGRVIAVHYWRTGFDELVFSSNAVFEAAKKNLEIDGVRLGFPNGYAVI